MTRLKERLDRRVARMSDDAKITQEMAILFAAVFAGVRLAFYVGRDVLHTWSWDWW